MVTPIVKPPDVRPAPGVEEARAPSVSPPADRAGSAASASLLVLLGLLAISIGACVWTLLRRGRGLVVAEQVPDGRDVPRVDGVRAVAAPPPERTATSPSVEVMAHPLGPVAPAIEARRPGTTPVLAAVEAADPAEPGDGPEVAGAARGEPDHTFASNGFIAVRPDPVSEAAGHLEPQTPSEVVPDAPEVAWSPSDPSLPSEGVDDLVEVEPVHAVPPPFTPATVSPDGGRDEPGPAAPANAPEVRDDVGAAAVPAAPPTASLAQEASNLLRRIVGDLGRDPERRPAAPAAPRGIPFGSGQATWFPAGARVDVAGTSIVGGLVYVGSRLPSSSNASEPDNCLVDPRLTVAKRADVVQPLPYWPSYARITPGWRRAYLDFLGGPRSDPDTPIGLVFLYFYGLERRALLDRATSELGAITAEARRLATVFGANHSFRHYADEFLAAADLLEEGDGWTPSFEPAAAVPMRLRVALGRRAAGGRPIDPELLLAVTMAHPETRIRTPARRALPILRKVFATKLAEAHPAGLLVKRVKTMKALSLPYRAASGSFTVEVHPPGDKVPDVLARDEPLATGRRILDASNDELDAFSRELGKLAGASPTLAALSKLPASVRREAADALPDAPLAALDRVCAEGPVELSALQGLLGLSTVAKATRARTSEAATVLAKFGFGLVPDPAHTLRVGKTGSSVVVFALAGAHDEVPPCSDAYRSAHLALVLGVMVALADGHVDARERKALLAIGRQSVGLSADEARRLAADLAWLEASPALLGDLKAHLAGLPADARRDLLDVAVQVSMADDVVTAREVSVLERIGRQLGLDPATVYSRLHGARRASTLRPDDDLPEVVAPPARVSAPTSPPVLGAPTDSGLDLGRLAAIRTETLGISTLLGEIFAEDEDAAASVVVDPPPPTAGGRDGLDAKHDALLASLATREEWTSADFERLVRGAGLMPGAARDTLNDWSLDRHDELVLEGDDPVLVNVQLVLEGV